MFSNIVQVGRLPLLQILTRFHLDKLPCGLLMLFVNRPDSKKIIAKDAF